MVEDLSDEPPAVVLTGAAGLIGSAVMQALAADGWRVLAVDRVEPRVLPPSAAFLAFDLSDVDRYGELVEALQAQTSRLKALINNAAINPRIEKGSQGFTVFENVTLPAWEEELRLNLTAPIFLTQALLDRFSHVDGRPCKIVNVTSMYGVVPPNQQLYCPPGTAPSEAKMKPIGYPVTKAALDMGTRYLAIYLARRGFNVNAIAPGGLENEQPLEFREAYARLTPMGRMGHVGELLDAFRLLCGAGSDYMCGHTLVLDGGWTIW